jgi:hypothetical protein
MAYANDVKDRFRTRLAAADARSNGFRQKLLEDGSRALRPVIDVLSVMAEVLNEEDNIHGSITGIEPVIDSDNFVTLCAKLRGVECEQKIKIKYGPELGGTNYISVSGLNQRYNERLIPGTSTSAHIGRVIGSDVHLDEHRGADLAEIVRDVIEDFYVAQIEQRSHFAVAA